ncbi:MAG TPA: 50S ribosomal protein L18e [archaeon]|nr:50S ribosomal protein L18e [archaeon]
MVKRTGPTNPYLKSLVRELEKSDSAIWQKTAEKLVKATRKRVEVNLSDINRHAKDGDVVLVPGVVLGSGSLQKSVSVAAWKFSGSAEQKIKKAKGKILTIGELVKEKPKGTDVKVIA